MAESSQSRRQELYDLIRKSSKDEVILEEMKKLGFWPDNAEQPSVPEMYFKRERELSQELTDLLIKHRRFADQSKILEDIRRERMAESRKKQAETKERQKREREEKTARWQEYTAKNIPYIGEDVSGGLLHGADDLAKLAALGLPSFSDPAAMAEFFGLTVGKLRFLAYNRKVTRVTHYQRFHLPKKRGGTRLISAPKPGLKQVQHLILAEILNKLPLHAAAHGFRKGHSIVSNARPHQAGELVVNIDLKDFFPSIHYRRIKGLYRAMGYSERNATLLGLLCTEPDVDMVELDGQTWYVAKGERHLPQGAPTSPVLTNYLCRRLDARLEGMAKAKGFTYTRYADDMTFSTSGESRGNLMNLLGHLRRILREEDLKIHPDKLRIMRKGARKEVTGVVVNEKLSISRDKLKRFRALLFQIEKDGPAGKTWDNAPNLLHAIWGYANFICMVNPEKGTPLVARVKAILDNLGEKPPKKVLPDPTEIKVEFVESEPEGDKKDQGEPSGGEDKPWWKFW
jgi:hypothetical protein